MNKIFNLKKLNKDDWQSFKDLRLKALQTDPSAFGASYEKEKDRTQAEWEERLTREDYDYFGHYFENRLVSMTALKRNSKENYVINAVYTDPDHRGKGLLKEILEKIIEVAKLKEGLEVSLIVNTKNTPAIALYKKLGFETTETENLTWGDGIKSDAYHMKKIIN